MVERPWRRVTVPADARYLAVLRAATAIALDEVGCDEACTRDLVLATDELAAVVLGGARPDVDLELQIESDDDDLYVRVSVPLATVGFTPATPELTELLLAATTASFEVRIDDGILYGVLQRERATATDER
jgi:hypothetical protein